MKIRLWCILCAISIIFLIGSIIVLAQARYSASNTLLNIIQIIETHSYYELDEKDITDLYGCILEKAFSQFTISKGEVVEKDIKVESCFGQDKYAAYISPLETKIAQETHEGEFFGIGIEIKQNTKKSGIVIERLISGGPAAQSEIFKKGDLITAAGNSSEELQSFQELSHAEIVNLIRGPRGAVVVLEVWRDGNKLPLITIIRDRVEIEYVEARELNNGIGYLKIRSFESTTLVERDVLPALNAFAQKGIHRLILDLRGNPGGLLQETIEFLEEFYPQEDKLIAEIRIRGGEPAARYVGGSGLYSDWNLLILVDEHSASASEISAGALQILGFPVIGVKTFGKGSVQREFSLDDGGTFRLTIARYYFANGETPDGKGIIPDIELKDDPKTKEDEVLARAIELLTTQH